VSLKKRGQPATSSTDENIVIIDQIVHENHQLTVRGIAEQVNIDRETGRKIITEDFDTRKVCAKKVPKSSLTGTACEGVFRYETHNWVVEHPAYVPDLAPVTFLFPKIKGNIERKEFNDIDDIRNSTTAALKAMPQKQFQSCFEGWTRRWHRYITSQGEYFEGDYGGFLH
jgi:hypothetical protein